MFFNIHPIASRGFFPNSVANKMIGGKTIKPK